MSAPDFELQPIQLPFEPPEFDTGVHAGGGAAADAGVGYLVHEAAGADEVPVFVHYGDGPEFITVGLHLIEEYEFDPEIISAVINFVPIIGQAKGVVEAFVGSDLITGRKLPWWERALNIAAIVPGVHQAQAATKAAQEIGYTARVVEAGAQAASHHGGVAHHVLEAIEGAHIGVHAEHLGEAINGEHEGGGKEH